MLLGDVVRLVVSPELRDPARGCLAVDVELDEELVVPNLADDRAGQAGVLPRRAEGLLGPVVTVLDVLRQVEVPSGDAHPCAGLAVRRGHGGGLRRSGTTCFPLVLGAHERRVVQGESGNVPGALHEGTGGCVGAGGCVGGFALFLGAYDS